MRVLLLLLWSMSFFTVNAQVDVIVLEPNIITEVEIHESDSELDIFFDAESDDVIQIIGESSLTNGHLDVTSVAFYAPDSDELMKITRFYSPEFNFKPYRIKISGRYRIHIIAREAGQVEIHYKVRETPDFGETFNSKEDVLYNTVASLDYTFTAEAGETITSYVKSHSFDAVLTLYDPSGEIVATDDDSLGALNPEISLFNMTTSGTYRLVVHSHNPDDGGQFWIYLQHPPPPPNNYMTYGEQVSVTFDGETPLYWFQFDGSAGDVVSLHIDDLEDLADVRIQRPVDRGRIIINTDDSGYTLYNQWDKFVLPSNHTYRLYITPKDKTLSGNVSVQLEHLASSSLEAGSISVHLSQKNPTQHFTFIGATNASATITINQDSYYAETMPYRITLLDDSDEVIMGMTIDDFIGSFSQTNTFSTGNLPWGQVTIEIEMLGEGPAWFDVSVDVIYGMG